LIVWS